MKDRKSLLSEWNNRLESVKPQISKISTLEPYPLGKAQQRLWLLQRINKNNPFYNYCELYTVRGFIDIDKLVSSYMSVLNNEVMFNVTVADDKEELYFKVNYDKNKEPTIHNGSEDLQKLAFQEGGKPFDLENGPLLRCTIVPNKSGVTSIIMTIHHIVTDKMSMKIFRDRWFTQYANLLDETENSFAKPEYSYYDYINWESGLLTKDVNKHYWLEKLKHKVKPLTLPIKDDLADPKSKSFEGKHLNIHIDGELKNEIKKICSTYEITPFVFFLSSFYILLDKYVEEDPIHIGTVVSSRSKSEFNEVIGFFNNSIILQGDVNNLDSIAQVIAKVQADVLGAFEHVDMPYSELVSILNPERTSLSENPLFNTMFLFHKSEKEIYPKVGDIIVDVVDLGVSKFDLTLYVSEYDDLFDVIFEFNTQIIEESLVSRLLTQYRTLIESCVFDMDQKISDVKYLDNKTLQLYNQNESNSDFDESKTVLDLFRDTVAKVPKNNAVSDSVESLSYYEIDILSDRLAYRLNISSNKESNKIAFIADRSISSIVSILAILKSGCAYIPLDPSYPIDRLIYIIEDSQVRTIIHDEWEHKSLLDDINLIDYKLAINEEVNYEGVVINQEQLAYIIHTSGSSGKPKGVKVTHKNLYASTLARHSYYKDDPTSFLLLSSFSFDSSVAGIFWTLTCGGSLVISPNRVEQDIDVFLDFFRKHDISHTLMIPRLYGAILDSQHEQLKSLHTVILAGEVVLPHIVTEHFKKYPQVDLYNEYGPTEASVWSTVYLISENDVDQPIPIGQPCDHVKVYLLSDDLERVPIGVNGQICIGGSGVTLGYLNDEEKTSKKFISTGLNDNNSIYLTGDLGRYDENGNILFLGRNDNQVKIRGYRVELNEIKNRVSNLVNSKFCEIIMTQGSLCLYHSDEKLDSESVQNHLKRQVPEYMVPTRFIYVEDVPFLPNGKLNKTALRDIKSVTNPRSTVSEKGLTEHEKSLIEVWKKVLNLEHIDPDDNFFSLGGDSIKSIRIISQCRDANITITAKDIFTYQTIRELSKELQGRDKKVTTHALDMNSQVLLPTQYWFLNSNHEDLNHWNLSLSFNIKSQEAVEKILSFIKWHYEVTDIYRINFEKGDKDWNWKYVDRAFEELWTIVENQNLNLEELNKSFDIANTSLVKWVINKEYDNLKLHLLAHHLVIDIISLDLILDSLDKFLNDTAQSIDSNSMLVHANALSNLLDQDFFNEEVDFWQRQIHSPLFTSTASVRQEKDYKSTVLKIDKPKIWETIQRVKRNHKSSPMEFFLATLLKTLSPKIPEGNITVNIEGNGRNELDGGIDISTAIGWFTSFYPLTFEVRKENKVAEILDSVRGKFSQVPNGGIGYGVLKSSATHLKDVKYGDITLNYIPYLDVESRFQQIQNIKYDLENTRDKNNLREELLTINIFETHLGYEINLSYHESISNWIKDGVLNDWQDMLDNPGKLQLLSNELDSKTDLSSLDINSKDLEKISETIYLNAVKLIAASQSQKTLLFHHLSSSVDEGVIVSSVDLKGNIDYDLFGFSVEQVIKDHAPLRQSFVWQDLSTPTSRIHRKSNIPTCIHDISHWYNAEQDEYIERLIKQERDRGIDLANDFLFRIQLIKLGLNNYKLINTGHHINLDGWSTMLFFKYIVDYYSSENKETYLTSHVQTTIDDISFSHNSLTQREELFWKEYLSDLPVVPKSRIDNRRDKRVIEFSIDSGISNQLNESLKNYKVSMSTLTVVVWTLMIGYLHGEDEVVFGLSVFGRNGSQKDIEKKIGLYANIVPVRVDIKSVKTNSDLLKLVQQLMFTINEYQSNELSDILECCNLPTTIFDSLLVINNYPDSQSDTGELQLSNFRGGLTSNFPITFVCIPSEPLHLKMVIQEGYIQEKYIHLIEDQINSIFKSILNPDTQPLRFDTMKLSNVVETIDKIDTPIPYENTNLATNLLYIWHGIFNRNDITIDDNFFDLGGNSIAILKLFSEIESATGHKVPPTKIFDYATVNELAQYITNNFDLKSNNEDSLITLRKTGKENPLFCFHAGDGHVLFYKNLADSIASEFPIYAIQPKDIMLGKLDYGDISEMAEDYLKTMKTMQPSGPYQILGTCFSAAVTFEMAKILKYRGESVSKLFIVDSGPPGHPIPRYKSSIKDKALNSIRDRNFERLFFLVKKKIKYLLKVKENQTEGFLNDALSEAKTKLDKLIEDYIWTPADVKINLIRSKEFTLNPDKDYHLLLWKKLSQDNMEIDIIKSKHERLFDKKAAKELGAVITKQLKK